MIILADTNILIQIADQNGIFHDIVPQSIRLLEAEGHVIAFNSQIKREFLSVTERQPGKGPGNNGLGFSKEESANWIRIFQTSIQYLPERPTSDSIFDQLHASYGGGRKVHDLNLVAFMLASRIEIILTINAQDFSRYQPDGIRVLTPQEAVQSGGLI